MEIRCAFITVGEKYISKQMKDECGDILESACNRMGWKLVERHVLGDQESEIINWLITKSDQEKVNIIFTIDGIGSSRTHRVPEALYHVCEKWLPGVSEFIRFKISEKYPWIIFTRGQAGMRGKSVIINLPASPGAIKDALDLIKTQLRPFLEQVSEEN
jgi:molybdenum cofactor synthesis domain-containing protein